MRRLENYAKGEANWDPRGAALGEKAKTACRCLHTNVTDLVEKTLGLLMDRVASREMETFTLHDRTHGLKVAHLMWQILAPERRERLTPPEIAMLVLAAHLHDLGMGLSPDERQARLEGSEIWERAEWDESTKTRMEQLRTKLLDPELAETARHRLDHQLFQAEEALLCADTRERHATPERYEELLRTVRGLHDRDRERIPDPDSCLAFDGDSFRAKLVDVCVSHNEDAEVLAQNDPKNLGYLRFPRDYTVGCAAADLQMVAAALRLADILDFDRERTPPALFLYLMPGPLAPEENQAVLEWSKHLAISHWNIDESAIVFKGRCRNHIVHHAVVQFCAAITGEMEKTKLTFGSEDESRWPFLLPSSAKAEIHAEGYKYVPYRFELDDQRIYSLLMGGAIYDNPLVAVRELVQNAVDACKLRDALTELSDPGVQEMSVKNRIFVRYEEPTSESPEPKLTVTDTGAGMDELILRTYFLKVGQSYYRSTEFNKHRVELRKAGLDFAPVSEFGIGFLSCFLLADRVKVETAMAEGWSGDTHKRTLVIDGPTRLIRLDEEPNVGQRRWKGTQVTLYLTRGSEEDRKNKPPGWNAIKDYLADVCQELPYDLHLEYGTISRDVIPSGEKSVEVPPDLAAGSLRIPIHDPAAGMKGELVLINEFERRRREEAEARNISGRIGREQRKSPRSVLLRGGFKIGDLPGLTDSFLGRIRLNWRSQGSRRYAASNLARNAMADQPAVAEALFRSWLTYLLDHRSELSNELCASHGYPDHPWPVLPISVWIEQYDAASLYQLARKGWLVDLGNDKLHEQGLREWEMGRGGSLRFPWHDGLSSSLLDLVLPRITSLELDRIGFLLLRPPQQGGLESLNNCHDYFRKRVRWGLFAAFPTARDTWLASGSWLNEKYRGELSAVFPDEERADLARTVGELIYSRDSNRPAALTPEQAALWRRFADHFPNLEIGGSSSWSHGWRIDSFKIAEQP
jgi:hypothetical protein